MIATYRRISRGCSTWGKEGIASRFMSRGRRLHGLQLLHESHAGLRKSSFRSPSFQRTITWSVLGSGPFWDRTLSPPCNPKA